MLVVLGQEVLQIMMVEQNIVMDALTVDMALHQVEVPVEPEVPEVLVVPEVLEVLVV